MARLAWHELRQQLGGRVFWIVFAVSVLMVAGAMAMDELRVGLSDEGARTGAAAIVSMPRERPMSMIEASNCR